tara:strand:+ start:1433 stop:2125 length:693 start_codon:yes stop_codon:yes gene_type:complete
VVLGILFLLPVIFLLFLYPSTNNYNTLDIVQENIHELDSLNFVDNNATTLENNITVLNFLGDDPENKLTSVLNLKELVYDKFKGFKKFQIITISSKESEVALKKVKKKIIQSDELKYWFFASTNLKNYTNVFQSLRSKNDLDSLNYSSQVFIVDKQKNQRGRIDDRDEDEIKKDSNMIGLYSYNSILVSEIKKKMNDDIRILFTEYRQKRKGNFNSNIRRLDDLDGNEKK